MSKNKIFAPFIAELDAARRDSLAQQGLAGQQGDLEALEIEVEQQKNLVNARHQLEVLQELWPNKVGIRRPKKSAAKMASSRSPLRRSWRRVL